VPNRKVASAPSGTNTLTLGLNPVLRDSLRLLSATRKAARTAGKPAYIQGMVDEAILHLSQMLKSDKSIAFVPIPRSSEGRTALRVSAGAHQVALRTSEVADVRLADFIRTALTIYVRDHANEIYAKVKTPTDRRRK
jgi:hypothetical protein